MEPIEIKSGPVEVVASGTVIAFAGNPVEIAYGPPDERLRLILSFQDEEGEDEPRIVANTPDPYTLEMILFNFDNPLGSGTTRPVPVGTLEGRRLHIHYRVYDLSGSDKTIHYTIYLGEEVAGNE